MDGYKTSGNALPTTERLTGPRTTLTGNVSAGRSTDRRAVDEAAEAAQLAGPRSERGTGDPSGPMVGIRGASHHSGVRFDLDPPNGVGPVLLGSTRSQAGIALRAWGVPEPFRRGGGPVGWMVPRPATVFVYVDSDERVDAVEFANPNRGQAADDQVYIRGIDLFTQPALEVLRSLEHAGTRLAEHERGYRFTAYDLVLALWRNGEPYDDRDLPAYFETALIAAPGYYD